MHHTGQGPVGGYAGEDLGQRLAVGHIAGEGTGAGSQGGQLGDQFVHPGRFGTASAHQQQVTDAVFGDQVPGDAAAEDAGAAGEEYRAVLLRRVRRRRGNDGAGETGRVQPAVAQGQLGLVGVRQAGDGRAGVGRVQVEQDETARVLGLRAAHQPPHRGGGRVDRGVTGGHGAPGEQDETGGVEALVGEPGPHLLQGAVAGAADRCGPVERRRAVGVLGSAVGVDGHQGGEFGRGRQLPGVGDDRPRGGGSGRGQAGPVDTEERVGGYPAVHGRRRPQHQGLNGGDRPSRRVGELQRDGVRTRRGQAHAQGGGALGVQGDAGPAERDADGRIVLRGTAQGRAVQGGVEEGGVQVEALGVRGVRAVGHAGKRHVGVDHAVGCAPGAAQALEERPVVEAGGGRRGVEVVQDRRLGVPRRPLGQGFARRRACGGQDAGRVPDPAAVGALAAVGAVGPGVEGDLPGAVRQRSAHLRLDPDTALLGQFHRGAQGQLVHDGAADLAARVQGEVDERGARDDDRAVHTVVAQPRVGGAGQPAGEHEAAVTGHRDERAQQRVPGAVQADRPEVGRAAEGRPVALSLEGVGGQVDPAGTPRFQDGRPVGVEPRDVQARHRPQQGVRLVAALPLQWNGDGGVVLGADESAEDAVGAGFDVAGDALASQFPGGVGEPDGRADLADPVLPGRRVAVEADGGDQRNRRRVVSEVAGDRGEPVEHGFHQVRVEGVRDREPLDLAALGAQPFLQCVDRGGVTGDRQGRRPVDRREVDAVGQFDLALGGLDGQHRAALGQFLHQPAAGRDQAAGVVQRQDARDVGGGQLADGVTRQDVGAQPP